ncbi:MAG: N-formylglutamate amidohydrolase [Armatimonadetes bacterium]|nr:N-formylglutamate amidohydrolase [Armatimonadota bacterium]
MLAEFKFEYDSPIVCTAIHNGHFISENIKENLAVYENIQKREEDSYTEFFTEICNNRIIGRTSRFEVDINRTSEKTVYLKPEDAWNLKVRKRPPTKEEIEQSLQKYHEFYSEAEIHFNKMKTKFGKFFVYDIHSYNHRRNGPNGSPADPDKNPEIILGTNIMSEKWLPLVYDVQKDLRKIDYFGRQLDVRINIKFPGGNFSKWIHRTFPDSACCIAIEFKKIFMDEWTDELFEDKILKLREALNSTLPGIRANLQGF